MIKRCFSYTGVLYLCVIIGLFFLMDHKKMKLNRLDWMSVYGDYPGQVSQHKIEFKSYTMRAALVYYKIISSVLPNASRAYEMQGYCYFWLKDYRHSRQSFKKALELAPQRFWLEFDLAVVALKQGECAHAQGFLKHILNENSQDQLKGGFLSTLNRLSPEAKVQLQANILAFVNEIRFKSMVLLSYLDRCQDAQKLTDELIPVMHPWSFIFPPGKEFMYD